MIIPIAVGFLLLLMFVFCAFWVSVNCDAPRSTPEDRKEPDAQQFSLDWTDFTMVYRMRLVKASRASHKGYDFLVFNGSPSLWDLHITKNGYEKLKDPIAGRSMAEVKSRAAEAVEAIEFMETKKCPEK